MGSMQEALDALKVDLPQVDPTSVEEEVEELRRAAATEEPDVPQEEDDTAELSSDEHKDELDFVIRPAAPVEASLLMMHGQQANKDQAATVWRPEFDQVGALKLLAQLFERREIHQNCEILMVMEETTMRCAGSMAIVPMVRQWAPRSPYLMDEWFWVEPWARRHGVADGLMQAAQQFAEYLGLPLILQNWTGQDVKLKDRYLSRHGFQYIGGAHLKVPNVGDSTADD